MAQVYEQNTTQIMQKCNQALQKQPSLKPNQFSLDQHVHRPAKKDQFKELLLSTLNSCISPHEESENNQIIEKLRKKNNKKKQLKQVVIRKTDLGENQLIFTKQELDKLKEIDDQELYGISPISPQSPSPLKNIINSIATGEQANKITGQQASKKYFINPISENPHDEIINYLDWVDMNQLKKNKDKKKSKILNFQKRQRSPSNSADVSNKMGKNPFPALVQKHSIPFRNLKNIELNKTKSCYPLANKKSADKGFLNSINNNESEEKRLGERQKLNEILFKVDQYVEKEYSSCQGSKNYIYMTEDRKQALYECEVLRRVKRQIGPKFYQNLQLSYGCKINLPKSGQDDMDYEKENKEKNKNESTYMGNGNKVPKLKKTNGSNTVMLGKEKNFTGQKEKLLFETQADRMIHKNRNRLKEERKRAIQRIVC